jgi:murein DD-endopeptidase MepM/ murein hydrolase activator NlpD
MKNKFYASLFIGIGLTLAAMPSMAKTAQAAKKPTSNSAKLVKTLKTAASDGKKSEPKKTPSNNKLTKSKSNQAHQIVNAKDNKHDKSHPLIDSKDNKHGKTKALADALDNKHSKVKAHELAGTKDHTQGKAKSHELADTKDRKHGKLKTQQLADAKDKHGRRKAHQIAEESYAEEQEVDSSTAVYEESTQTADNSASSGDSAVTDASNQTLDTDASKTDQAVTTAPKTSPLFFLPLHKNNETTSLTESRPQASEPTATTKANSPLISAPTKINNDRVHTLISQGAAPQIIAEKTPLSFSVPSNQNDALTRHNANNFIDSSNHETSTQVASTHGVVDSSLVSAGEKAGLSNDMIIELTEIFAWDIDFANNLQAGDQFTVIYEAGEGKARNKIIAAEFVNRGKTYTAIRYKDKEGMIGYYNRGGQSVRKAFLTSPVDFVRVSSPFSTHRHHPILNRIRAHKGVDYAARTGTPVKAAGDGIVTFHGTQGGYGRMIVISHGEHYETAYAHLSNFKNTLQDGEHVKQGEIIGYVGQSGLATGPHLHYEFRIDGVHQDPEQLDRKQGTLLTGNDWQNFKDQTLPLLTRLNAAKANTLFAANKPNPSDD